MYMHAAFISDIHGNTPALEAVLADIYARDIPETFCLGDLVGYGPDPVGCINLVKEKCAASIMGNHDWALLNEPIGFNPVASEAIRCNRQQMRSHCLAGIKDGGPAIKFLQELPQRIERPGLLCVHASPRDELFEYVLESEVVDGPTTKIIDIFTRFEGICVVGHSHLPGVITPDFKWIGPAAMPEGLHLESRHNYLINDGSVGQPRDADTRACYLEIKGHRAFLHRVAYDYHKTASMIRALGCLPSYCAERLEKGI